MPNPYSSGPGREPSPARGRAHLRPPRSERDLARRGYAGQGYHIYGEPEETRRERGPNPQRVSEEKQPGWFGAASSAYAFGYTTSLRPSEAARGGHAGKGPRGYVRPDARIREDVCERLSDDDEVDASDIEVSVKDAEVLLEGTISDRHTKRRAEMLAMSVRGVSDVHNRLRVQMGLLRELGHRLTGEHSEHHGHHGSGTR